MRGSLNRFCFFSFGKPTTNVSPLFWIPQVRDVLESRRGGPDGFKDEFVDKAVGGMDDWSSAARRGLMCWGFVVLQKPVSKSDHSFVSAGRFGFGRLRDLTVFGIYCLSRWERRVLF